MSQEHTLQQAIDTFVQLDRAEQSDALPREQVVELCMEMLAQYLIHYSDLFHEPEFSDEAEFAEWEEALEQHMADLLQGDVEPTSDLGSLPLSELDPEHLRDFLGWFVVRESSNAELIEDYITTLQLWLAFLQQRGWVDNQRHLDFIEAVAEISAEAVRVAKLARVLFHFVRSGSGISPMMRGKRFSGFVEGHGRVAAIEQGGLLFDFDTIEELIGPVVLPKLILQMIEPGDVFDVELGQRAGHWLIVDIGPVYPASVYVEVEAYEGLDKLS